MANTFRFHVFFGRPRFRRPPKQDKQDVPGAKTQRRTALSSGIRATFPRSTSCWYASWLLSFSQLQWARTASFETRLMNECAMPATFRRQRAWKASNLRVSALLSHKVCKQYFRPETTHDWKTRTFLISVIFACFQILHKEWNC